MSRSQTDPAAIHPDRVMGPAAAVRSAPFTSRYSLAVGPTAERRLRAMQAVLLPSTLRLLTEAGIQRGMHVADLGCGAGSVMRTLSELVGPQGSVTGVDISDAQLNVARARARQAGLTNCRFLQADVANLSLPSGSFDLIYCRFLLVHVKRPEETLVKIRKLLGPEGILACEEPETSSAGSEPESILDKFGPLLLALGPHLGNDWDVGRRLYRHVRAAGFVQVEPATVQPAMIHEDTKRILEWTIAEAGTALIEAGIIDSPGLDRTLLEMQRAAENEDLIVFMPRMFQVHARASFGGESSSNRDHEAPGSEREQKPATLDHGTGETMDADGSARLRFPTEAEGGADVVINGVGLTIEDVLAVSDFQKTAKLSRAPGFIANIDESVRVVDRNLSGRLLSMVLIPSLEEWHAVLSPRGNLPNGRCEAGMFRCILEC
jgi:SAM-dependent methyltransferase